MLVALNYERIKFLFIFTFGFSSHKDKDCFLQILAAIQSSMGSYIQVN